MTTTTMNITELAWRAYGWFVNRANCCVVGCGCVVVPILLMGGAGGLAALIHFT